MAYCTQSDIEKQLPSTVLVELTNDDGGDTVDSDVVTRAIEDADEEIDAFISIRYDMPFSTTPGLIRRFAVDLSICSLYARRGRLALPADNDRRCKYARRMLERIAEGRLKLDVPDPDPAGNSGVMVTTSKDDRAFTIGRESDGSTGSLDNY